MPKLESSKSIKIAIIALFIIFVLLRLFVDSPTYYICGDDAKYLGLVKNFPAHTLHGDFLYLAHGPVFPYAIKFFNLFVEDHIAGFFVAFSSSLIIFIFIILLFRLFNKNWDWIFYALLLYSLSVFNIFLSHAVLKETLFMALSLATIYFYLRSIKVSIKNLWLASLFGILVSFTSDHVIFLIGIMILTFLIFGLKQKVSLPYRAKLCLPIAATIFSYSIWILTRIYIYTHNIHHPCGNDGTFEYVRNFGWKQIISPFSFPESLHFHTLSFNPENSLSAFAYLIDIFPFSIPLHLNRETIHILLQNKFLVYLVGVYLPVSFLILVPLCFSLYNLIKNKRIFGNQNVYFILFAALSIYPLFHVADTRYGILVTIPMIFFFANSMSFIIKFSKQLKNILPFLILIVLTATTILFLSDNPFLFFEQEKLIETHNVASYIEDLPEGAVMAQMGYSLELAYLLDRPVYALPSDTSRLEKLIKMYRIKYLVFGQKYWAPINKGETEWVLNYRTIKYIQSNSRQFKLMRIIKEYDPEKGIIDELYVYTLNS